MSARPKRASRRADARAARAARRFSVVSFTREDRKRLIGELRALGTAPAAVDVLKRAQPGLPVKVKPVARTELLAALDMLRGWGRELSPEVEAVYAVLREDERQPSSSDDVGTSDRHDEIDASTSATIESAATNVTERNQPNAHATGVRIA